MTMRPVVLGAALIAVAACSSKSGSGGTGGGDGSGGGFTDNLFDAGIHTQCASVKTFDEGYVDHMTDVLKGPFQDTTTESTVTADGCFRSLTIGVGGALSELKVVRYSGQSDIVVTPSGVTLTEKPDLVLFDQVFTPPGSSTFVLKSDTDLDGFFETETDQQVGASGLTLQKTTTLSPATQLPMYRRTFTPNGAGVMHTKIEQLVSGSLATTSEFDAPAVQQQSGGCMLTGPASGPDVTVPCAAGQVDAIKAQIAQALKVGTKCMLGASVDDVSRLILLQQLLDTMDVSCFSSKTTVASVDTSRPSDRIPVNVNATLGTCDANFQLGSLFHEMMHLIAGSHDNDLDELLSQSSQVNLQQYTYVDRMRSCERLCFGSAQNKCACATCLQTKTCDHRCDQYGSCVVREQNDAGMNVAIVSEAVGAVCQSNTDATKGEIYKTMAACMSACGAGSSCSSKSVSCDPTCQ